MCSPMAYPSEPVLVFSRQEGERSASCTPHFQMEEEKGIRHQLRLKEGSASVSSVLSTLLSTQNGKCAQFLLNKNLHQLSHKQVVSKIHFNTFTVLVHDELLSRKLSWTLWAHKSLLCRQYNTVCQHSIALKSWWSPVINEQSETFQLDTLIHT